jgi:hypothetical protein
MSADSPQACVGAAPGSKANPTLDSLLSIAVPVVDTRWFVISNDLVARAPPGVVLVDDTQSLIISTEMVAAREVERGPPGLLLQARSAPTTTTTDHCNYCDHDYDYDNYYYYYHVTPLPLYCCAQGDLMPRASRECPPIFGGHSAGRGCTLGFGDDGIIDGCGPQLERLDVKHFCPRRTCVLPDDRMPAVASQRPPGLHFLPGRTCVLSDDRMPAVTSFRLGCTFLRVVLTCRMLTEFMP